MPSGSCHYRILVSGAIERDAGISWCKRNFCGIYHQGQRGEMSASTKPQV